VNLRRVADGILLVEERRHIAESSEQLVGVGTARGSQIFVDSQLLQRQLCTLGITVLRIQPYFAESGSHFFV
jgi:hypothetical protein